MCAVRADYLFPRKQTEFALLRYVGNWGWKRTLNSPIINAAYRHNSVKAFFAAATEFASIYGFLRRVECIEQAVLVDV